MQLLAVWAAPATSFVTAFRSGQARCGFAGEMAAASTWPCLAPAGVFLALHFLPPVRFGGFVFPAVLAFLALLCSSHFRKQLACPAWGLWPGPSGPWPACPYCPYRRTVRPGQARSCHAFQRLLLPVSVSFYWEPTCSGRYRANQIKGAVSFVDQARAKCADAARRTKTRARCRAPCSVSYRCLLCW